MSNILVSIIVPVYNCAGTVLTALNSIPQRKDVEVIIVDDCSTDDTKHICEKWLFENNKEFAKTSLLSTKENCGCGGCKNVGYDAAVGDWIWSIDADDYFYTDKADIVIELTRVSDHDIIVVNNTINEGEVWTGERPAAWAYLVRRSFLGDSRCPIQRRAADWHLYQKLKEKNPTIYDSNIVAYHYNYLYEGSTTWKYVNGLVDECGLPINSAE